MFDLLPVLEELYRFLMAGHQGLTASDYLKLALAGLVGALIYSLSFNDEAPLPARTNGTIKPGILGVIVLGVLCGIAVGRGVAASMLAGFLGPLFVPALVKAIKHMMELYQQRKRENDESDQPTSRRDSRDDR